MKLETAFADAIDDLESGDETAERRANDALTALRFELYHSPNGRAQHAELEQQLDNLVKEPG
jgi:hypothetical protein